MLLKELADKKIVILGFGEEGKDTFFALRKLFPEKTLGIADQLSEVEPQIIGKDKKVKWCLGKDYLKALKNYDLIIKTPGIPQDKIKPFLKKGEKVTSQTEIFFDNFKGAIIGVTGTKGKGTTSGFIYHILKRAGKKVYWLGNVGNPVFECLLKLKGDEIIVYELSSHQLQGLKKSPHIAVFLNLMPDHLDYYKNLKEYQRAKESIAIHQKVGDWFVYNSDDKIVKQIAQKTKAKKVAFSAKSPITDFERSLQKCNRLRGEFNWLNLKAALLAACILKIPDEAIREAVENFKPLPHRLEFVGKYKGIEFYDDSMATIPEATIEALKAFKGNSITLILGGSEKGSDYQKLAKEILKNKVKILIVLSPGTGEKIWQWLQKIKKNELLEAFFVSSMKEAVKIAYERTNPGDVCLLSPGAASFNLFKDYKDRGNQFRKWVKYYSYEENKKN